MRAMTEGLPSPHPLGRLLPGIYLEDELTQQLTQGLDDVVSSLLCTLDNLDAYFDPDLTPADFLDWLGGWVGLVPDPAEALIDRRTMIKRIVEIYRWRGTGHGLRDHIVMAFGLDTEIVETGGVSYSTQPRSTLPGNWRPEMIVRIRVADPSSFDTELLDRFIDANKPAHVPHWIEVLPLEGARPSPPPVPAPQPPSAPARPASRGPDPEEWTRRWSPSAGRVPQPGRTPVRGSRPVGSADE